MDAKWIDFSASYDVQQTCLNGHVTNNWADDLANTQACSHCKGPIRGGHKYNPGPRTPRPDAYCLHCGKPYPWTESRLYAVQEIAKESEHLDSDDRIELASIMPDLIAKHGTPKTEVAIVKLRKLMKKGGGVFGDALRKSLRNGKEGTNWRLKVSVTSISYTSEDVKYCLGELGAMPVAVLASPGREEMRKEKAAPNLPILLRS